MLDTILLHEIIKICDEELSFPKIKCKVYDGDVFWTTLAEYNGWKLQQHTISQHARLLNPNRERIAWGSVSGMEKALKRIKKLSQEYEK